MVSSTAGREDRRVNPGPHALRVLSRGALSLLALIACAACALKGASELPDRASIKSFAATADSVLFIPATAHVSGAQGTNWRTDLELLNPGTERATVTIALLEPGQGNLAPVERTINIEAGRATRYEDVLSSLFGYSGGAALRIVNSDGMVAVTSRTYNLRTDGTYGQFAGGVLRPTAIHFGQEGRIIQLTHNRARDAGFRTNIGFVNANATTTRVEVALYGGDGSFYGNLGYNLEPYQFRQVDKIYQQVVGGDVEEGYAVLTTPTADGAFFAYATVIDNRTGDPIYVTPVLRSAAGGSPPPTATPAPTGQPTPSPTPTATPPTGQANLLPYQPSGWSAPLVVSGTAGTSTSGGLTGGAPTYIDGAVINAGSGPATFQVQEPVASVDTPVGRVMVSFPAETTMNQNDYARFSDVAVNGIDAGEHTITLAADPNDLIDESSEADNSYQYTGSWAAAKSTALSERPNTATIIVGPTDPRSTRPIRRYPAVVTIEKNTHLKSRPGLSRKAASPGDSLYIPASAHASGAAGTNWRTDVELHNPGAFQAQVEIALLRRDRTNPSPQVRTLTVGAGRSRRLVDVLDSEFGFSGAAALRITVLSGDIIATSRTYNLQPDGTYGLFAGAVSELATFAPGEQAVLMQLTHHTATNTGFRTNVGMLNCSSTTLELVASFHNASGSRLGTQTYSLGPFEFIQEDRIFRAVTGSSVDDGYIVFTTASEGARYLAYATVVDNKNGDSIFIPAISVLGQEPAPVSALLAAQTVFDGLGQIGQGDVPTIEEVIADLQANGMEQMVAATVSMLPEGIATAIPGGVRVDFGSHLVLDSGNILSGSVETTYSNVVISNTEVSFDFVVDQHNLLWNGGYAEIDGLTGSLESEVRTGGHAAGDVAITSFRRDTKSEGVTVDGFAHFDTEICANYPISGSLTVSKDGQDYTIDFTDACDGTFDAPNQGQTGDVSFRLTWSGSQDLDLHVREPSGEEIDWSNPTSATHGQLDVDSNSGCGSVAPSPTENVFWPEGEAPHGTYEFWVERWSSCDGSDTPAYTLQVFEGTSVVRTINGTMPAAGETEHYTHQY